MVATRAAYGGSGPGHVSAPVSAMETEEGQDRGGGSRKELHSDDPDASSSPAGALQPPRWTSCRWSNFATLPCRRWEPLPAVLEQVIVQPLPEARVVEHVARVWVPQMALPSLDVPRTGLHDPTDMIVLDLNEVAEEVVEDVLEMFDQSIDRFEHSAFRPRRLCVHFMLGRCERGWSLTFPHVWSSTWTRQYRRSRSSSRRTSCSRLWLRQWLRQYHRSWQLVAFHRRCAGWCADSQEDIVEATQ